MNRNNLITRYVLSALIIVTLCCSSPVLAKGTPQEAIEAIGVDAFVYTYPLVLMDLTRLQMTNIEAGKMAGRGPMMTFTHVRTYPEADHKEVVRPNFDTLYSLAWIDLTKEPAIIFRSQKQRPILFAANTGHVDRCFCGHRDSDHGYRGGALRPCHAGMERRFTRWRYPHRCADPPMSGCWDARKPTGPRIIPTFTRFKTVTNSVRCHPGVRPILRPQFKSIPRWTW